MTSGRAKSATRARKRASGARAAASGRRTSRASRPSPPPRAVAATRRGAPAAPARARAFPATDLLALAREVVRTEAAAIRALEERLDGSFLEAVGILAACRGKVIVSGVGKSGLIAHKIAATLTSTGTPAVFLHPADALHGDAGLFRGGDAALFVSKSGASDELLALLPYLERHGIPLVSVIASPGSPLAGKSQVTLVTGPLREACPMDLTPTTSITAAQVMGDCLAIALLEKRGFRAEDFRFLHPGGVIGHAAARRVDELMHDGDGLPLVGERAPLREVMLEIMAKRLGIATVVDGTGTLAGVISDGDFKRILVKHADPWSLTAGDIMSRTPSTIAPDALVAAAVRAMEERPSGPITALVVVDADRHPIGVLHLHDCLRAGR
jgi:arabinose-5-phosphate isomerase